MNTLQTVARSFALFNAAWPSARKTDESTVRVWAEALHGFSDEAIERAARKWITTQEKYPNLPSFIAACREFQPAHARPSDTNNGCPICEGAGWVYTDHTGRGTVAHCENGCLPPPMGEISEAGRVSTAGPNIIGMLRDAQDAAANRRREIGDRAYLTEKGYDPDKFRISGGMIMANPPAPKKRPERHRS